TGVFFRFDAPLDNDGRTGPAGTFLTRGKRNETTALSGHPGRVGDGGGPGRRRRAAIGRAIAPASKRGRPARNTPAGDRVGYRAVAGYLGRCRRPVARGGARS